LNRILLCFPEGKHKALTMSYDDGRYADRRLVAIFNRYGIKGSFHLNGGLLGTEDRISAEEAATLYEGHELSAHTLTHPTIERCPNELLVHEIMEDRKVLEGIAGYTVRGMSYPNGSYNKRIKELLPKLGIQYARVVQTSGGFGMPDDWHEWRATCHHNDRLLERGKQFIELHKQQYLYLMNVWGHSYEFDQAQNWELMEQFGELVSHDPSIWFATNIEIFDYVKAYEQLQFSGDLSFVFNPTAKVIWLNVNGEAVAVQSGMKLSLK